MYKIHACTEAQTTPKSVTRTETSQDAKPNPIRGFPAHINRHGSDAEVNDRGVASATTTPRALGRKSEHRGRGTCAQPQARAFTRTCSQAIMRTRARYPLKSLGLRDFPMNAEASSERSRTRGGPHYRILQTPASNARPQLIRRRTSKLCPSATKPSDNQAQETRALTGAEAGAEAEITTKSAGALRGRAQTPILNAQ